MNRTTPIFLTILFFYVMSASASKIEDEAKAINGISFLTKPLNSLPLISKTGYGADSVDSFIPAAPDINNKPLINDDITPTGIIISSGMITESTLDFGGSPAEEMPLYVERFYSQLANGVGGWEFNFKKKLTFYRNVLPNPGPICTYVFTGYPACNFIADSTIGINAVRGNGVSNSFLWNSSKGDWRDFKFNGFSGLGSHIVANSDGTFTLFTEDNLTEKYSHKGQPLSVTNAQGIVWTYNYDQNDKLLSITHSSGRKLLFTWGGVDQLTKVTLPDGNSINYTSDSQGITLVQFANGSTNGYSYTSCGLSCTYMSAKYIDGVKIKDFTYRQSYKSTATLANGTQATTYTLLTQTEYATSGTVTNAKGLVMTYYYTKIKGIYRLSKIDRPVTTTTPASTKTITYDSNGYFTSISDWNGNLTIYSYDAGGRLLTKANALRTVNYVWDLNANRIKDIFTYESGIASCAPSSTCAPPVPWSAQIHFDFYDMNSSTPNRIQSVKVTQNAAATNFGIRPQQTRAINYSYLLNPNKTVSKMTIDDRPYSSTGNIVTYQYDSIGNLVSVVNNLNQTTTYSSYDGVGRILQLTDANGLAVTIGYDGRGNVLSINNGGRITSATYNGFNKPKSIVAPSGATIGYQYDLNGLLTRVTTTPDFSEPLSTPIQCQDLGENKVIDHYRSFTYDSLGGVSVNARGWTKTNYKYIVKLDDCSYGNSTASIASESFTYDSLGRVQTKLGSNGQSTSYYYDGNGNTTKTVDALGRVTLMNYNADNQLVQLTDAINGIQKFAYTGLGYKRTVTDAKNNTTTFTMSIWGDELLVSSPDTGTTTNSFDAAGSLISSTNANGTNITFTYDSIGRLRTKSGPTETQTYTYDCFSPPQNYSIGRVCSISDASGSTFFNYNVFGEKISQANTIGSTTFTTNWSYDSFGRVSKITYPNGVEVTYTFNSEDDPNSATAKIGSTSIPLVTSAYYESFGDIKLLNYGNGLIRTTTRDSDGRITGITTPSIQGLNFTYTKANEIASISNSVIPSLSQTFTYDNLSRVKTISQNGTAADTYNYDANGNRSSVYYPSLSGTASYSGDTYSNRLLGINFPGSPTRSLFYDLAGNTKQDVRGTTDTRCYYYNDYGQVVGYKKWSTTLPCDSSVTPLVNSTYLYNALKHRVQKTSGQNTSKYIYSSEGKLFAETLVNSNSIDKSYVWFGGHLIAFVQSNSAFFVHGDQVDRPETVTNMSKSVVWRANNLAFSRSVAIDSVGGLNIGFPGQYYDGDTGLWYNVNRFYDSAIGRYTQSDPKGLNAGLNTYVYALNNPLIFIDEFGLDTQFGVSFTGTLFTFIGGGNVTFTIGITTNWTAESTRLFTSEQVSGIVGLGLFAGLGIVPVIGHTDGPLTSSSFKDSAWTPYFEADLGFGTSAGIAGNVDRNGNASVAAGHPEKPVTRIFPGAGWGIMGGIGASKSATQVYQTSAADLQKMFNDMLARFGETSIEVKADPNSKSNER